MVGFSLVPELKRNLSGQVTGEEYGSIQFIPRFKALNFIVGLAPISLWALLWYLMVIQGIVVPSESYFSINLGKLFSFENWWVWMAAFQLIPSGMPSVVDIRGSIKGFYSLSGLLIIAAIAAYISFSDEVDHYLYIIGGVAEDIYYRASSFWSQHI